MKGVIFALTAGIFLALQGIINSHVGDHVGTWKAVLINQLGGFVLASIILLCVGGGNWRGLGQVKKIYLFGGALAAIIVFSNISAMHLVGATLTVAAVLISQLCMTFLIDARGWFDTVKQQIGRSHLFGIGLMIIGVLILRFS